VQCSTKVSACRRGLNSHNAAKPRSATPLHKVAYVELSGGVCEEGARVFQLLQFGRDTRSSAWSFKDIGLCSKPSLCTAYARPSFSQFVGPPRQASARVRPVIGGGLKTWHTIICSAEREAIVAYHQD
jgi:hypothetical protein